MTTQKNTTSPSIRALEKILDDAFEMGKSSHPEDYANLKQGMLKKALALFETLAEEARVPEKQGERRQIPCPDGKVGCLVLHWGKDVIKSERDHGYNQGVKDYYSNLIQRIQE